MSFSEKGISKEEIFNQLAELGYNRIPVVKQVMADLETPVSCYLKLAQGPYSYLFESVQGGEKRGRYSMIGLPSRTGASGVPPIRMTSR
mgnify:CR=1 FL=1